MNTLLAHLVRAEGHSLQGQRRHVRWAASSTSRWIRCSCFVILPRGQETLGAAIATALSNVLATGYFVTG